MVLDLVMISTSGHKLIENETLKVIMRRLMELCDIVTPNAMECHALLNFWNEMSGGGGGASCTNDLSAPTDVEDAARKILSTGAHAVLIKGGHFASSPDHSQDYLLASSAARVTGSNPRPRLCDAVRGL